MPGRSAGPSVDKGQDHQNLQIPSYFDITLPDAAVKFLLHGTIWENCVVSVAATPNRDVRPRSLGRCPLLTGATRVQRCRPHKGVRDLACPPTPSHRWGLNLRGLSMISHVTATKSLYEIPIVIPEPVCP
ncbi:hypothetical protein PoB_006603000 [Plakobranchus ocellatus]|uniref:Uncharacterized protein n=1 Tax=Plakobranchus ocellatus TaxID=259542 RepID=A0AAV4D6B0_9GAST|nr:hypothetical protein PoB_006603000 [Plakobranchus ocellatus]